MATLERPIIWNYIFCSEAVIVIVLYGRSCSLQLIGPRKIWQTPMYFLSLACLHACLLACLYVCLHAAPGNAPKAKRIPHMASTKASETEGDSCACSICLCSSSRLLQTRKTFASASSHQKHCYLPLEGCWGTEAVVEIYISKAKWPVLVFKRAI